MKLRTKLWLFILLSSISGFIILVGLTLVIGTILNDGYTHVELDTIGESIISELEQTDSTDQQVMGLLDTYKAQYPKLDFEWFSGSGTLLYSSDGRKDPYSFDELMSRYVNMPQPLGRWQ